MKERNCRKIACKCKEDFAALCPTCNHTVCRLNKSFQDYNTGTFDEAFENLHEAIIELGYNFKKAIKGAVKP